MGRNIIILLIVVLFAHIASAQKRNPTHDRSGNRLKVKVMMNGDTILGDIVRNLEDSLVIRNDKHDRLSLFKDDIKYKYQWPDNDVYTDTFPQRPFPYTYIYTQSAFSLERSYNHNVNFHNTLGIKVAKYISATLTVVPLLEAPNSRPGVGGSLRASIPISSKISGAIGISSGHIMSYGGNSEDSYHGTLFDRLAPYGIVSLGDKQRHLSVSYYHTGLIDTDINATGHIFLSGTTPITKKLSLIGEYGLLHMNTPDIRTSAGALGVRYFIRFFELNTHLHFGLRANITQNDYFPVVGASFSLWRQSMF